MFVYRRIICAAVLGLAAFTSGPVEHKVSQKDKAFSLQILAVKVGDTVIFRNDDAVTHNVFSSTAGFEFNLKTQKPGESSPVVFDRAGEFQVRCAFHPTMKLLVKVGS